MSATKLKRCPFCGGEARLNYERIPGEDKGYWAQVICKKCIGRSGGTWAGSYKAAATKEIKAWNIRKPMQNIVERLKKLKVYAEAKSCPKDGMCDGGDCENCYINTAIEIVKEEGGIDA